jgi:phage gp36-like protein
MSYCTPAAYIARYGLAEAAQLLADKERTLTPQLLADALAGTWTGSPTQAEKDVATAALARLVRQLQVKSDYIDGYLRTVAKLPLAGDSAALPTLEDCCGALTRGGLADDADQATERMTKTADNWRAWLTDISKRRVQLVGAAGEAPPSSGGARTGQATSAYDWSTFGGVR